MKLVTFGCSRTYGSGLPDIYPDMGNMLGSSYAWPVHFKNYMGSSELLNLAKPGIDNSHISRLVLEYSSSNQGNDDFYIIQWTAPNRISFYNEITKSYDFLGPWSINDSDKNKVLKAKNYYSTFHSELQSKINTLSLIYFIQLHLEKLNKKYFMFSFIKTLKKGIPDNILKWYPLNKDLFYPINSHSVEPEYSDIALDNNHNGVKFHKRFAELLYEYHIGNKNMLP